jgi:hypothetical protein
MKLDVQESVDLLCWDDLAATSTVYIHHQLSLSAVSSSKGANEMRILPHAQSWSPESSWVYRNLLDFVKVLRGSIETGHWEAIAGKIRTPPGVTQTTIVAVV